MRSLPTRRELVFVLVVVVSFILFFQFALGTSDTEHDEYHWSNKVLKPWGGPKSPDHNENGPGFVGPTQHNSMPVHLPPDHGENAVIWADGDIPTTEIKIHVGGWTVFERLYLCNGTIFIVTDEPKTIPDRMLLTSSGAPLSNKPEEILAIDPTDADLQIITSQKAKEIFGSSALWLGGTSFVVTEAPQFIAHYYHWAAETFLGLWRAYSLLDPDIQPDGSTFLEPPRRFMMSHVHNEQFRDHAGMNQFVTRGVWPSASIEYADDWADRALLGHPFLLERAVLSDRAAATHNPTAAATQKGFAELFKLNGSPYWWKTVRNNLIKSLGGDPLAKSGNVITYVSRQAWGRRMLKQEDHDGLVKALERLERDYGYEVHVVSMEQLSRKEQILLAARTTILMGVHGNGLTALLWMNLSKRATVMEFYYPSGFAYDYEMVTRILGMKHYGFWGNEYFTSPDLPAVHVPPEFQGTSIPIDGEVVARLCIERLSIPED
ncbi:hypothetical protein BU17DRAFT_76857 [Hysterangium stoloniferum]|nr:hypothetical protein BU17DRAFT_76857 [Hysterangium stoloniferum]